jgi:hypothetical protein
VWCQSEIFVVAAVTVSRHATVVTGKKNGTWLAILRMKPDESCSLWLWHMQLCLWCLILLSYF